MNDNFSHYLLQDDDSYKVYVQNSINRIESVYGQIKFKYAKGSESCQIMKRIKDAAPISDGQAPGQPDAEIDCLIMLDRDIDLVSPFCVS